MRFYLITMAKLCQYLLTTPQYIVNFPLFLHIFHTYTELYYLQKWYL